MTMSALQQILAGKKPQPASPSTSAPAATPAATPAASASPPATIAPAPAATPSASSPAAAPTPAASAAAAPSAPAASAVIPGPNAASVSTPQGGPPDTLAAVLGAFVANAGKMPQVNPPEAPKVLAGPTALEVAGHPEPEKAAEPAPAPVEKPADVLAAEQAKAKQARRTAAVVQAELDISQGQLELAQKRIAELESALAQVAAGAEIVSDPKQAEALAEAVELIQQLQAEAQVQADDNAKAWARVAVVEAERDAALVQLAAVPPGAAECVAAIAEAQLMTLNQAIGLVQFQLPVGCSVTIEAQR